MIGRPPSVVVGEFKALFGRKNRLLIVGSIFFLLSLHWVAAAVHELFRAFTDGWVRGHWEAFPAVNVEWLWVALFFCALFTVFQLYERLNRQGVLNITARVRDCDGLVFFISKAPPRLTPDENDDLALAAALTAGTVSGDLASESFRKQFKSHLRMPIEGLHYQCNGAAGRRRPKRVMLLASLESSAFVEDVQSAFSKLLPSTTKVTTIKSLADGEWNQGFDYADAEVTVRVAEAVYRHFHAVHIPEKEVLVDVTGGFALTSILAAIVAMKGSRRVQFTRSNLDRTSYTVDVFDFEYQYPPEE